jgi:hypothetical protein
MRMGKLRSGGRARTLDVNADQPCVRVPKSVVAAELRRRATGIDLYGLIAPFR